MSRHIDTIQSIYQAFGRGDVPAILERLSPQVQWDAWDADRSTQGAAHPLLLARTGPGQVAGFFTALAELVEFHEFRVVDLFGSGRQVAGEIVIDCTYRTTGRRIRDDELHLWTLGEDGKVVRFRHYVDTAKHLQAAGVTLSA